MNYKWGKVQFVERSLYKKNMVFLNEPYHLSLLRQHCGKFIVSSFFFFVIYFHDLVKTCEKKKIAFPQKTSGNEVVFQPYS